MKLIVAASAAALAVGMFGGSCEIASAQSDRTLGSIALLQATNTVVKTVGC